MRFDGARAFVMLLLILGMGNVYGQINGQRNQDGQQLLVQIQANSDSGDVMEIAKKLGATVHTTVPALNAVVLNVPPGNLTSAISAVKENKNFKSVEILHGNWSELFVPSQVDKLSSTQQNVVAQIKSQPSTAGLQVVTTRPNNISVQLLGMSTKAYSSATSNVGPAPKGLSVSLEPGLQVTITDTTTEPVSRSTYALYGRVERDGNKDVADQGTADLIVNDGRIAGSISLGTEMFDINPVGDGVHVIVKVKPSGLPPDHPPGPFKGSVGKYAPPPRTNDMADTPLKNYTIRALVVYTPQVAAAVKATGGTVEELAQSSIVDANAASINSNVRMRIVLAGTQLIQYKEVDFQTDLNRLVNPHDGYMDEVHAMRKAKSADIVFLLSALDQYCGLSAAILASAQTAFSVVAQSCAHKNQSLAHELGHLLGSRHDRATDSADVPFKTGHGYIYKSAWRTLLAYGDPCQNCQRLPYWATPTVTYQGQPVGTKDHEDEITVINQTAAVLSTFHLGL